MISVTLIIGIVFAAVQMSVTYIVWNNTMLESQLLYMNIRAADLAWGLESKVTTVSSRRLVVKPATCSFALDMVSPV